MVAKPNIHLQEAGVQHFIWSSLLNVTALSKGKLSHVRHFDSKAAVEEYVRKIGIPASFFLAGLYMKNLPGGMLRQVPPHNTWTLGLPIPTNTPIPLFDAAEDTGKFVKGILLNREKTLGQRIYGATDYYTVDQIVKEFKEVYPEAGKNAAAVELPEAVFKGILVQVGQPEEAAEELTQNMRLMNEFGYYGGADLNESQKVSKSKFVQFHNRLTMCYRFWLIN
jgi:uncharacterized protein YbjT (DUF2867 family)